MNTNSKRLGIYLSVMLVATALATSLRAVACVNYLNYSSGLFSDKTLIIAANTIIILCAIGMFSYIPVATRINLYASFSTGATYVPTGILGVATAFLGIKTISYALRTSRYPFFSAEMFTLKSPVTLLGILVGILALLSVAHHFFNALITDSKTTLRAYFAIATIAFLALYSTLIYLDSTLSVNDLSKVLRQMAFIFCAIFFLYEARISLGREMWRMYTAFGLVAASVSAYTAIPAIITYYVKGATVSSSGSRSLASIEEYLLLLALFIFILARLCLTTVLKEKKENELIKMLGEYARETEKRVYESYERHQMTFAAKQLSIFDLYGDSDEKMTEAEPEEEVIQENTPEDEDKEPTISDDAIYEAIFGKMPERPIEKEEPATEPEPVDDREPEKIAEDLLNAVEEALKESKQENKKETEI